MQTETNFSFGYWLRRRRKALDLTQEALAARVGCSVETIRKLEADARRPSQQVAELLAGALSIPDDERQTFLLAARGRRAVDSLQVSDQPVPAPTADPLSTGSPLPIPATSLIGRAREIARIRQLLQGERPRLLTLTGPPGIGKTRLALEAALELQPWFADGVCFVPLAHISDPDLVLPSIARALGAKQAASQRIADLLAERLAGKRLLLVLDNFEQVVAAGPQLASLLEAAPRIKALVTSREVLRVYGEYELAVPALSLPDTSDASPEQLMQSSAVQLFVERAQAANADLALTLEQLRTIAAICERLDGLPLAVELAAARCKLFSPPALLERLEHRLSLLTVGPRDLPARQQTLRGAIAWSYELLGAETQALFRRLGVFVGGWSLQAAEAICGVEHCEHEGQVAAGGAVFDVLASLVDKSLVQRRTAADGSMRFYLLETIREYALEQLAAHGEAERLYERHLRYYLSLAEDLELKLLSAERWQVLETLKLEYDNLRAALGGAAASGEVKLLLRLSGALIWFWPLAGLLREGRDWLEQALALSAGGAGCRARARALNAAAHVHWLLGSIETARGYLEEALSVLRSTGADQDAAVALNFLGHVSLAQGDHRRARVHFEQCLALLRTQGHTWSLATTLFALGDALLPDDAEAARAAMEESLALWRRTGDRVGTALPLTSLGRLALRDGDVARAEALITEGLELRRGGEDRWVLSISLNSLGDVARYSGDYRRAEQLYAQALELGRKIEQPVAIAWSLYNLGAAALGLGRPVEAAEHFAESLALERGIGSQPGIARCLAGIAGVLITRGEARSAALLLAAAAAVLGALALGLEPADQRDYERYVAIARERLGQASFAAACEEGRALTPEQAVAYALQLAAGARNT